MVSYEHSHTLTPIRSIKRKNALYKPHTSTKRASKRVRYLRQEAVAVSRWCIFSTPGSQYVRDLRSDHQGEMLHMFSVIVGKSRNPATELPFMGQLAQLDDIPTQFFLPSSSDVAAVKDDLAVLVGRILTQNFRALEPFSKAVPKHILHKYSGVMSKKSDVVVLDVLMKNEAKHKDMLDIMRLLQDYLGDNYPDNRQVLSGGDQMTCERQVAAQRHMMDGNTEEERWSI